MKVFVFSISILFLSSCGNKETQEKARNISVIKSPIEIQISSGNYNLVEGEMLRLQILNNSKDNFQKISVFLNDSLINESELLGFEFEFPTTGVKLGANRIRVTAMNGEKLESKTISFNLFSNKIPKLYDYQVVNSFPHDRTAYTQGLIYHNGFLYEGTGQIGLSSLRKVNLADGKIVQQIPLEKNVFGEGIVLLNGFIYQLSWKSNVGFVYSLNEFKEVRRFYYNAEGWGLTSDGTHLIMSNGSNRLSFHEPENFTELFAIEVCSNVEAIGNLNELEYINGKIYANVWQTDEVVIIDPKSGRLEGRINFKNLLPPKDAFPGTDVLNGIAYDAEGERLFVTGKNWSRLFEVKIIPHQAKS